MKIAVFENEYASVKIAFETANLLNFQGSIEITVYPSSQSANLYKLSDYSVIFIDIDLSANSHLDGFALIREIIEIDNKLTSKIIILTANNKIEEILKSRSIDSKQLQIIIKPTDYEEITKVIKKKTE